MDIVTTIDRAGALGLQLTVTDGRLNVTGSKTAEAAALVRQLSTMKAAVIAHLTAPTPQPAPETLVKHSIGDDLGNLPPMRMVSKRPALPRDMWLGGLTPAAALAAHGRLSKEYFCSCGADAGGWFVRCDPQHYEVVNAH